MCSVTVQYTMCGVHTEVQPSAPSNNSAMMKLPELVELPLVMVNGTFRCLEKLEGDELEDFLRYLCHYTASRENRSRLQKPIWWTETLIPFSVGFARGRKLVFARDKVRRLRHLIKRAYHHYGTKELLEISSRFSRFHILSLSFKPSEDGTVLIVGNKNENSEVRIPASNLNYDFCKKDENNVSSRDVNFIEIVTLDDDNLPKKCPNNEVKIIDIKDSISNRLFTFPTINDKVQNHTITSESDMKYIKPSTIETVIPEKSILILDSDDDDSKSKSEKEKRKDSISPSINDNQELKTSKVSHPKKRFRLCDKLKSLQQSGSLSIFSYISISDDDISEDDDDCQIVDVLNCHENNLPKLNKVFSLHYGENSFPQIDLTDLNDNEEETEKYQHTPNLSINQKTAEISKDLFLSQLGLISQEKYQRVKNLIKQAPVLRRTRLRAPLYHMPLEFLPLLASRGVINRGKLEYSAAGITVQQPQKYRRTSKRTRRQIKIDIPANIQLKDCRVILKRLPTTITTDKSCSVKEFYTKYIKN